MGLRVKLVLIRHGDAGDPDPGRYPDDRLRPLTPKGEHEHRVVGQILAGMGLGFTHLLTSPLRRAHQTAEITARTLGWTEAIESVDALGENFSVSALLEKLGDFPDRAVVACVGHEPHLSRFAAALLHPDGTVRFALSKSGVLALDCAGKPARGTARLLFLLPPDALLQLMASHDPSRARTGPTS